MPLAGGATGCSEAMRKSCCCPQSAAGIAADQEVWHQCEDLTDYARRKAPNWGGDGFLAEGNSLRFRISSGRCFCTLRGSRESPISKTHCLCWAGHTRGYLEPVFEMPVRVDPVSTVTSGDPECWFVPCIGGQENLDGPPVRPAVRGTPEPPAPLKARIAPFPAALPASDRDRKALRQIHAALAARRTESPCSSAATASAARRTRCSAEWTCLCWPGSDAAGWTAPRPSAT